MKCDVNWNKYHTDLKIASIYCEYRLISSMFSTALLRNYFISGKTITIKNGSLLDYDGNQRTFVMRFQEVEFFRIKREITGDLLLVIQLEDVKEAGSLVTPGFSGCCDGVNILRWMVPVCTAVEFFALLACLAILMKW